VHCSPPLNPPRRNCSPGSQRTSQLKLTWLSTSIESLCWDDFGERYERRIGELLGVDCGGLVCEEKRLVIELMPKILPLLKDEPKRVQLIRVLMEMRFLPRRLGLLLDSRWWLLISLDGLLLRFLVRTLDLGFYVDFFLTCWFYFGGWLTTWMNLLCCTSKREKIRSNDVEISKSAQHADQSMRTIE